MPRKKKPMTRKQLEAKHALLVKEYLSGQKTRYKKSENQSYGTTMDQKTRKLKKKRKIKQKVHRLVREDAGLRKPTFTKSGKLKKSIKKKMDRRENIRETKPNYKKIRSKAKYDRHGNLKKVVTRKGGKRIVTKFKKKGIKNKKR
jgi:hypothetical protein